MNVRPKLSPLTIVCVFGALSAVASNVVGKHLGPALASTAMYSYSGFAFQPTNTRALIVSASGAVWSFGVYLFSVRRDMTGFAVALVCLAICLPIVRRFRPRELKPSGRHPATF